MAASILSEVIGIAPKEMLPSLHVDVCTVLVCETWLCFIDEY